MKPARILFVDDESAILDGLRNLLRKDRTRWDMVFAAGGDLALDEIRKAPFDIVVSDMRMPGMDGAEFLTRVKAESPGSARVVLSGHSEREAILRALPVCHQFLSKPCDANSLRAVIERICDLRLLLQDENLRALVGGLAKLPSMPQTYFEITQAASDPSKGLSHLARIVQRDQAMSAKVLQLANSSFFGISHQIVSIEDAVNYLGFELLRALALTAHTFMAVETDADTARLLENLQDHALFKAQVAGRFLSDAKRSEEAFTVGLLHDVGIVVMAVGLPGPYWEIMKESDASARCLHLVEKERLGVTHAEVGAFLLGEWGLPLSIVETVAYHHMPRGLRAGPFDVLAAVHVADALSHLPGVGNATAGHPSAPPDLEFLERSGFAKELPVWRGIVADETVRFTSEE